MIILGDTVYVKDYVEQFASLIGNWYSADEKYGTLLISNDGKVQLYIAGSIYNGKYLFENLNKTGKITTNFNNIEWTFNIRLEKDQLIVETGSFIAGNVIYTRTH
jgi:hypothetical protein